MRKWYREQHYQEAVAVAPGVWAAVPVGGNLQDALASGVFEGLCPAVKAYEAKYLSGGEVEGPCW